MGAAAVGTAGGTTGSALARHQQCKDATTQGYSVNSIYALVKEGLNRVRVELLAVGTEIPDGLTVEQIERMVTASPHAFRHTFGTIAVEKGMAQAVVQDVMGHADSSTTKLYSKSRAKHIAEEAARFYAQENK